MGTRWVSRPLSVPFLLEKVGQCKQIFKMVLTARGSSESRFQRRSKHQPREQRV